MDISAANWSEDDNANTTAAPDGAPEGMAPSGVNNVLRAHQGALKRFYNWTNPKITGGSGTAYTLSYTVAPGALVDGMTHLVQFHAVNGTGATLNINSLGATPLHYYAAGAWRVAPPGLMDTDEVCRVAYHSSSGAYRLIDRRNRTGEVVPFAGSTAPAGRALLLRPDRIAHDLCWSVCSDQHDLRRWRWLARRSTCPISAAGSWPAIAIWAALMRQRLGGGTLGAGLGSANDTASTTVNGSTRWQR